MLLIAWLQYSIDFPSQPNVGTGISSCATLQLVWDTYIYNERIYESFVLLYKLTFRYYVISHTERIRKRLIETYILNCVNCEGMASDCPAANVA
jgi:hypothetical protein